MKTLLVTLFLFLQFSSISFAANRIESVEGTGYGSGMCQGGAFASFCVRNLEDQAERDAERNADLNCRLKQGNLQYYSGYCSKWCNPSFIPEGNNTYVSCSARCRYSCEIRQ